MKTKEELNQIKEEYRVVTDKLRGLSDDELMIVTGGIDFIIPQNNPQYVPQRYFDTDPKRKIFEYPYVSKNEIK